MIEVADRIRVIEYVWIAGTNASKPLMSTRDPLPLLLTVVETAALLRTSRKAVYAMIARRLLPGVTRIGRRVLVRSADLLDFLDHNRAPSPQEYRR